MKTSPAFAHNIVAANYNFARPFHLNDLSNLQVYRFEIVEPFSANPWYPVIMND